MRLIRHGWRMSLNSHSRPARLIHAGKRTDCRRKRRERLRGARGPRSGDDCCKLDRIIEPVGIAAGSTDVARTDHRARHAFGH